METTNGEKQRFQGNWKCMHCGKEILSLPFQPRGTSMDRLQCMECYKKSKEGV